MYYLKDAIPSSQTFHLVVATEYFSSVFHLQIVPSNPELKFKLS